MHLGTNCCHMAKAVLILEIRTRRTLFSFFFTKLPLDSKKLLNFGMHTFFEHELYFRMSPLVYRILSYFGIAHFPNSRMNEPLR